MAQGEPDQGELFTLILIIAIVGLVVAIVSR
jgi:hypothetical protein